MIQTITGDALSLSLIKIGEESRRTHKPDGRLAFEGTQARPEGEQIVRYQQSIGSGNPFPRRPWRGFSSPARFSPQARGGLRGGELRLSSELVVLSQSLPVPVIRSRFIHFFYVR
jgi:hypothetical protein